MTQLIGSIWWFIIALGLLVTFHEFGHFWVARRCGVKVLRFSIGFGKALWKRTGKDGTEYVVAAIPLGGYVKMLDEREGPVPQEDLPGAFNRKPLFQRTAVIAAGPVFNLFFAIVAFWLMFMVGIPEFRAIFGETSGIAEQAGVQNEDQIVAVNGQEIRTLTHASIALLNYALDRENVAITLEDKQGKQRKTTLALDQLDDSFQEEKLLEEIGLNLWQPEFPAIVGELSPGWPAAEAGFQSGDRIVMIEDQEILLWQDLGDALQIQTPDKTTLNFRVERNGLDMTLTVTPKLDSSDGRYKIGIGRFQSEEQQESIKRLATVFRYGPIEAFQESISESWRMTTATLGLLYRMVTGKASLKNLSGPVSIAQYANTSAQLGLNRFLFFLGILSLSLAILNFLPIPILDGGHLFYNLIEWIKGSPVSDKIQMMGQYVGLIALFGLMSLTFYNDILRLLS